MLKSHIAAAVLLAAWACAAAQGGAAPGVERTVSLDGGRRDVSVHFYVDGHKRNKEANMDYGTSHAFVRAVNALRSLLSDRENPISAGLRRRGLGSGVEVNTGAAYLLKPDGVMPFSLSKKAGHSDFGAFGKETGEWGRDVLVRQILENEKSSRNVVVCVISNDPDLATRHGAFHFDEERGIMFFMLHAPVESVNAGVFKPYWSPEKWGDFLRDALGVNANDVANAIVDSYYALSEDEEKGLAALVCTAEERRISVKRIRQLPQRKTWTTTVMHNGKAISLEEDSAELEPAAENELVASVVSPAGVAYVRKWNPKEFVYGRLCDDERLFAEVKDVLANARKEGQKGAGFAALSAFAETSDAMCLKSKLYSVNALVKSVSAENERLHKLHALEKEAFDAKDTLSTLTNIEVAVRGELKKSREDISKQLEACRKSIAESRNLPMADIESLGRKMEGLKERIAGLEKKIAEADAKAKVELELRQFEKSRSDTVANVTGLLEKPEHAADAIKNRAELESLRTEANNAKDAQSLAEVNRKIAEWKAIPVAPKVEPPPKTPEQIAAEKRAAEIARQQEEAKRKAEADRRSKETFEKRKDEVLAEARAMLDDPANADDAIQNRAELEALRDGIEKVQLPNDVELDAAKEKLGKWKRLPIPVEERGDDEKSGGGAFPAALLLALVAGAGLAAMKFVRGKAVAKVLYTPNGSTDGPGEMDVRFNRAVRVDGKLGCPVDLVVVCRKGEAETIEFELRSPGRDVWLMLMGGTDKKAVGADVIRFDEGVYLLFESKVAIEPVGQVEFRRMV